MAAEVADGGEQLIIGRAGQQAEDRVAVRPLPWYVFANGARGVAQQPLLFRVGQRVDAPSKRVPAGTGEQSVDGVAVLGSQDLPTSGLEHPANRAAPTFGTTRSDDCGRRCGCSRTPCERTPDRCGRADAYRAGRVVRPVWMLGPARVGRTGAHRTPVAASGGTRPVARGGSWRR